MGVHSADITDASALHAAEEPQDSNDFRWVLWRQTRSCQRCGHRAAQELVRASYGRARRCRGVEPPPQLPPTLRRLPRPAPATWVPSHVTNVMISNIELYLAPARRPAGHGSTPAPPRVGLSRSTPRGSGSTDHRLCVLHEGPTYPQYSRPSSSGTPPSCSASRRHRQPPQSPGRPLSDRPKQQLSHPADPPHRRLEKS